MNYCLLGAAFLGSSILTMMACKQGKLFKSFRNLLSEEQLRVYNFIAKERLSIYIFKV